MRSVFLLALLGLLCVSLVCGTHVSVSVDVEESEPHVNPFHHAHKQFLEEMLSAPTCTARNIDYNEAEVDDATNQYKFKVPFQFCGRPTDIGQNIEAWASEWPPKTGTRASVQLKGTLSEEVTAGYFNLNAKIFFFNKKFSGAIPKQYLPLKQGDFDMEQSFDIPNSPIHGTPAVTITVQDQNHRQITCIKLSVHI